MSYDTLHVVTSRVRSGMEVPEKLLHALEIAAEEAAGAPGIHPTPIGSVGASPAATAAWLGEHGGRTRMSLPAGIWRRWFACTAAPYPSGCLSRCSSEAGC
ncbi:hypothetical protein ACFQYP_07890 [Nonomuraea antimicrobica]